MGDRLQHQDLDHTAQPSARFRRWQEPLQESGRVLEGALRTVCCVLSQQHSGEGDVLELVQVAEVVLDGQAGLTDPVKRVIQLP